MNQQFAFAFVVLRCEIVYLNENVRTQAFRAKIALRRLNRIRILMNEPSFTVSFTDFKCHHKWTTARGIL